MTTLGERLRRERQQRGLTLSDAATQTRIAERYLAAIEAGDFSRLPGTFFTKSFVRQYAEFLGVGREEIEAELERIAGQVAPPLIPGQEPRKEGSDLPPIASYARAGGDRRFVRALATLVGVVVVCATIYAVWLHRGQSGSLEPVARANPDASAEAAQPVPAALEPAPAPAAEGVGTAAEVRGPLWFQLVAEEATWVDITSGGQRLYQGILEPNQTKTLSGLERARLVVGNAGGLRIVSNGRPMGPIGARGQVRVVMLSPEGAQVLEPRKKADDEAQPEPAPASLRG
jgi:cytoskeletal protein RodZ